MARSPLDWNDDNARMLATLSPRASRPKRRLGDPGPDTGARLTTPACHRRRFSAARARGAAGVGEDPHSRVAVGSTNEGASGAVGSAASRPEKSMRRARLGAAMARSGGQALPARGGARHQQAGLGVRFVEATVNYIDGVEPCGELCAATCSQLPAPRHRLGRTAGDRRPSPVVGSGQRTSGRGSSSSK